MSRIITIPDTYTYSYTFEYTRLRVRPHVHFLPAHVCAVVELMSSKPQVEQRREAQENSRIFVFSCTSIR